MDDLEQMVKEATPEQLLSWLRRLQIAENALFDIANMRGYKGSALDMKRIAKKAREELRNL